MKTNRRNILIASTGLTALFALGAARMAKGETVTIRPPGGQIEKDFSSACIRCNRCTTVCPTSAITPSGIEDGFFSLRLPVMNYYHGYCDFCKKCIDVCPTGALVPFEEETKHIGLAELTNSCIALRTGGCTKCFEECPYEAITLDDMKRPVIDNDKCNGCGKCVFVCPAHVLQSFSGSLRGIQVKPRTQGDAQ